MSRQTVSICDQSGESWVVNANRVNDGRRAGSYDTCGGAARRRHPSFASPESRMPASSPPPICCPEFSSSSMPRAPRSSRSMPLARPSSSRPTIRRSRRPTARRIGCSPTACLNWRRHPGAVRGVRCGARVRRAGGWRTLLARRPARWHQGVHQPQRRVHGQRRTDPGRSTRARRRRRARDGHDLLRCRWVGAFRVAEGGARRRRFTWTPAGETVSSSAAGRTAAIRSMPCSRSSASTSCGPWAARSRSAWSRTARRISTRGSDQRREWDTAAAQAVLEIAGGAVTTTRGEPLRYNQRDTILNPHFLAFGDRSRRWSALFD